MTTWSKNIIAAAATLLTIWLLWTPFAGAQPQRIRKPAVAGTFYPADPENLAQAIDRLTKHAESDSPENMSSRALKALIMPHAGFPYSGAVAARAAPVLKPRSFSKIVIMAPDHRAGFQGVAVSNVDSYQTPLGRVSLHPDAAVLRRQHDLFRHVPESDQREHAVEVILPFLQVWLSDFEIIPVVIGRNGSPKPVADAIQTITDNKTLIIVSTDLSHYLPYERASSKDRETIDIISRLESGKLKVDPDRACGWRPLLVLMEMARRGHWQSRLLHYANSGDTAGRRDQVVGYATIAFYEEARMNQNRDNQAISPEKGEVLLEIARQSIAERLGVSTDAGPATESTARDPVFQSRRGTFVTLKINDQLRGCIGNLVPEKPLIQGVKDNAVNAAFHDPRFPPLAREEFSNIEIEVSLLTEPQLLEYTDARDLLNKIRPNIDGLIIRKGPHSSTFLPQVWEQLPDKKDFLQQLCMKAGLPPSAWEKGDLQVFTYQVQYFEEHR